MKVQRLTLSRIHELPDGGVSSLLRLVLPLCFFVAVGLVLSVALTRVKSPLLLCGALLIPPLLAFVVLPGIRAGFGAIMALTQSFGVWHSLLTMLALSSLTFRLRDVQDINAEPLDAWALLRVSLESLVAVALAVRLFTGRTDWLRSMFRGPIGLLSAFIALSLASAWWSVEPAWTLYKSLEYGIGLALLASLAIDAFCAPGLNALFDWMWVLVALAVAAVWLGALVDPADAFSYGQAEAFRLPELSGVWPLQAANSVGDLGALLSIAALVRLTVGASCWARRKLYWLALAVGMATMLFAQCRSAIAGLFVGAFVLLVLRRRAIVGAVAAAAMGLIAAAAGFIAPVWTYLQRGEQAQQVSTLSGRLDWWTAAWSHIVQRPLIGFGGFAGGRFVVLADSGGSLAADIHSTFVETLLDTGALGLVLVVLALATTWWILWHGARSAALDAGQRRQCTECLAVLGLLSVRAFFSTTLVSHSLVTLTFLLVVGYAESIRRRMRRRSRFGFDSGAA